MSSSPWPQQVAILYENPVRPGGLSQTFATGFRENGCTVDLLGRNARWNQPYDLVLGYGPSSWEASLLPTAQQLLSCPPAQRPLFYWWFIECIPDPGYPTALVRLGSRLRVAISRRTVQSPAMRKKLQSMGLYRFFLRGFRLQILGELGHFQSQGLLGGLAVTSLSRAEYLQRHGFRPLVVPIGYHPDLHGRDLGLERDIDVGFLGNVHAGRRFPLLERVRTELEQRGVTISIQTNLYGEERTEFLNRTKIILNIFRAPYDFFGLRFLFCAANKTLLISEPVADHEPFVPGRHMVAEPIEKLADTIEFYLSHDNQRQEIVEAAYCLVLEEYTINQMVGRILDDARRSARPGLEER
jgi:hypothetical protein